MAQDNPMGWRYFGQERPDFADDPGAGQESVWDYPRPPAVVPDPREVVVMLGDREIARTRNAVRVLETASPPTFYLPLDDVDAQALRVAAGGSWCEWKGQATYYDVLGDGDVASQAAWSYREPSAAFSMIATHAGFYPGRVACFVDDERVRPQPGHFYAGWITDEIVGPFKGGTAAGSGW